VEGIQHLANLKFDRVRLQRPQIECHSHMRMGRDDIDIRDRSIESAARCMLPEYT
jgi:hypothetical protein